MDKSFISFTQALENGQMVSASGVFANYDGETLDMEGFQDGTTFYAQLSNEDIMQLLAARANTVPLEELVIEEAPATSTASKKRSSPKSQKKKRGSSSKKRSSRGTRKSSR